MHFSSSYIDYEFVKQHAINYEYRVHVPAASWRVRVKLWQDLSSGGVLQRICQRSQ